MNGTRSCSGLESNLLYEVDFGHVWCMAPSQDLPRKLTCCMKLALGMNMGR